MVASTRRKVTTRRQAAKPVAASVSCPNCKTTAAAVREIAPSIRRAYLKKLQSTATDLREIDILANTIADAHGLAAKLPHENACIVMRLSGAAAEALAWKVTQALCDAEQFIIDNPAEPEQDGAGGAT